MTAPVLVVCAMESEAVHLRRELIDTIDREAHGWRLTSGSLGASPVHLLVCDIGMVSAASATTAMLVSEQYRAVINYGCTGAHRDDIHCGDVVIGERVQHLGSFIVDPDGRRRPFGFDDATGTAPGIDADPHLLELASTAAQSIELPPWPNQDRAPTIHLGHVGSADVWTQHPDTIAWLHETYGTLCEDMEAAAIAEVCQHFKMPFLTVKDISNNELQKASELNPEVGLLAHVESELGRRAAVVVRRVIGEMGL